jgi:hypothetical protein
MVGVIAVVLAGLSGVGYVISIANSAPPLSSLKPADKGQISTVYASKNERLGVIQAEELRLPAPASTLPKVLKDATVAIEDERFYKHNGVDYEGHRPRRGGQRRGRRERARRIDDHQQVGQQPRTSPTSARTSGRSRKPSSPRSSSRNARRPGSSTPTSTRCPTARRGASRPSARAPPLGSTSTSRCRG